LKEDNMRKIFFTLATGFCGMDGYSVEEFDDDVTDAELNDNAQQLALSNAEMYGVYPSGSELENYDEEEIDDNSYSDNIEGYWVDYLAEEHDKYL
jgi:hypothetical protein